jgi:hypothetical protein
MRLGDCLWASLKKELGNKLKLCHSFSISVPYESQTYSFPRQGSLWDTHGSIMAVLRRLRTKVANQGKNGSRELISFLQTNVWEEYVLLGDHFVAVTCKK